MGDRLYISATFTSWQGSGHLIGMRQHFIRFAGCSLMTCHLRSVCDEPAALTRKGAKAVDPADLVEEALCAVGKRGWMHITGGEPTDQPEGLQELVRRARLAGLYVHVQTNGMRRMPVQWDWLTCSPKVDEPLQTFGQELIVVDDGTITIERLRYLEASTKYWCYYLQPVEGGDLSRTTALAEQSGWMLTCQMHKVLGVR